MPVPVFYPVDSLSFSTKKERPSTSKKPLLHQPAKSAPPISRIFAARHLRNKPLPVSFKHTRSGELINSRYYDESRHDLFLEQCFTIEAKLGEGSFGEVFKARSKEDGKYYAIKRARERFRSVDDRNRKLNEVQKHEKLPGHPNLVKFIRAWEEQGVLYIQTELCLGSLSQLCDIRHDFSENEVWYLMVDILRALRHLHERKLLHLDVKPDNIFISPDGLYKLGDFGLVIDFSKSPTSEFRDGDAKYLAPEMLDGRCGPESDMFSFGLTVLEVATDLDVPQFGETWQMLRKGDLPTDMMRGLSSELRRVVSKMMSPKSWERPSATQLLDMLPRLRRLQKRRSIFIQYSNLFTKEMHSRSKRKFKSVLHRTPAHDNSLETSILASVRQRPMPPQKFDDSKHDLPLNRPLILQFDQDYSDGFDDIADISSIHNSYHEDNHTGCSNANTSSSSSTQITPPLFGTNNDDALRPYNSTPAQKLSPTNGFISLPNHMQSRLSPVRVTTRAQARSRLQLPDDESNNVQMNPKSLFKALDFSDDDMDI